MTVTTNYLVTGNGITGSTANAVQALVSKHGIPGKNSGIYAFDGRAKATHTVPGASGTAYRAIFTLPEAADSVEIICVNGSTGGSYTIDAMTAHCLDDTIDLNSLSAGGSIVSASVAGADTVPAATGTDQPNYLICNPIQIDNPNGSRVVALTVHLQTAQAVTVMGNGADGASTNFTNWATRPGKVVAFRKMDMLTSAMTTAASFTSTTNISYSPIVGCRFHCRGKVVTILLSDDSIGSGQGTYKANSPLSQALDLVPRNGYSVSVANLAFAGASSANTLALLGNAFAAGFNPDYVLRMMGTPNDTGGAITTSVTKLWRQTLGSVNRLCGKYGAEAMFRTCIPANHAGDTPAGAESWGATDSLMQAWNAEALSWRERGVAVFDWWSSVAGAIGPGGNVTFAAGLTTDGTHPNDEGNAAIVVDMVATRQLP